MVEVVRMKTLYIPDFDDMEDLIKYLRKHKGIPVYTEETKKDDRSYIEYTYDEETKTVKLKYGIDYEGNEGMTLMENGKLVAETWEIPPDLLTILQNTKKKLPLFDEWYSMSKKREEERLEKGNGYLVLLECFYPQPDQSSMQVVAFNEEDAMKIAAAESPAGCYPVKAGPIKF
mgnify:CR=1 FL=1